MISLLSPPPDDSPDDTQGLANSRKECKRIATSHYENFLVASVLLPRSLRQPFFDVYAFCRTADDVADESPDVETAIDGIAEYRTQIGRIYEGAPVSGIFIALAETIGELKLPRKPFDDLLDAFVQDQSIDRYDDESQLIDYCQRSANPVGRLVLAMAQCDNEENVQLSDQVCTGLQLANFWQDVARDFQIGRIYLPSSIMSRFGFDEEMIRVGVSTRTTATPVKKAIAHQCAEARKRFTAGLPLIEKVPPWLAADVELFIRGGLATLNEIEKTGYDVLRQRVRVGKLHQAWMVGRILFKRTFTRGSLPMVNA